ncbi:MAG: hypothetical protein ACI4K7_07205 [Oscillospiraceae bacterium]
MKLEDYAEVIVGQIMTRVTAVGNDEGETIRVLTPKAISNGVINMDDVGTAVISKEIDMDKYTRKGDVVIKLSTPYDAAYITAETAGLAIPSYCAIIRLINVHMDAGYLSAYLNSRYVRDQLTSKVSGGVKPMVKVTDIRSLEIPNISESDMKAIGEAFMLSGKKKETLLEMIRTEEQIMNTIVMNSIIGGMRNE